MTSACVPPGRKYRTKSKKVTRKRTEEMVWQRHFLLSFPAAAEDRPPGLRGASAPAERRSPQHPLQPALAMWGGRRREVPWREGSSHGGNRGQSPNDDDTAALSALDHPTLGCRRRGKHFSPNLGCLGSGTRNHSRPQDGKRLNIWSEVLPKLQEGIRLMTEPPKMTLRT